MLKSIISDDYANLFYGLLCAVLFPIALLIIEKIILHILIRKKNLTDEYKQYKSVNKSLISESKFVTAKFRNYKKLNYMFRIIIAVLIVAIISTGNLFSPEKYYDMHGNEFHSKEDVIFYDREGNRYVNEPHAFVKNYDTGEEKRYSCVDSNGYLIDIYKIEETFGDDYFYGLYYNKDKTNFYYNMIFIYWNENGEMVFDNGMIKIENVTSNTNPYDFLE